MRDLAALFLHLVTTLIRLAKPGGLGTAPESL
jgi:hypothetical protein